MFSRESRDNASQILKRNLNMINRSLGRDKLWDPEYFAPTNIWGENRPGDNKQEIGDQIYPTKKVKYDQLADDMYSYDGGDKTDFRDETQYTYEPHAKFQTDGDTTKAHYVNPLFHDQGVTKDMSPDDILVENIRTNPPPYDPSADPVLNYLDSKNDESYKDRLDRLMAEGNEQQAYPIIQKYKISVPADWMVARGDRGREIRKQIVNQLIANTPEYGIPRFTTNDGFAAEFIRNNMPGVYNKLKNFPKNLEESRGFLTEQLKNLFNNSTPNYPQTPNPFPTSQSWSNGRNQKMREHMNSIQNGTRDILPPDPEAFYPLPELKPRTPLTTQTPKTQDEVFLQLDNEKMENQKKKQGISEGNSYFMKQASPKQFNNFVNQARENAQKLQMTKDQWDKQDKIDKGASNRFQDVTETLEKLKRDILGMEPNVDL